jgi:hypothetical protein
MHVPEAKVEIVRAMVTDAIAKGELSSGETSSLCGKLQFCLSWGVGRFGRAAMGALYRHVRARRPHIQLALEMSLNFLQTALTSLRARDICVRATSRSAPILLWSDVPQVQVKAKARLSWHLWPVSQEGPCPSPSDPAGRHTHAPALGPWIQHRLPAADCRARCT